MLFSPKDSLRILFRSIIDVVYPPLCLSCQALLDRGQEFICPDCWGSIATVTAEFSLFMETRDKLLTSGVIDDLVSIYVFEKEGAFQVIVHQLKYGGIQALGLELGKRLGRAFRERSIQADAIVPVPLHRTKQRERGYNQAELIARGIAFVTNIPVRSDLIRRRKYTETQTHLSLVERQANMENAFEMVPGKTDSVRGKYFVIVDDVVTTGSTIVSCGGILRSAGAGVIIAASIALAE
jgi:ComF family protein